MKTFTHRAMQPIRLFSKTIFTGSLLIISASVVRAQPGVSTPAPLTICTGSNAGFAVTATGSGPFTYQWQESEDNGASWNPLTNNTSFQVTTTTGVYTGVNTAALTITRVPSTMDQYLYNVIVTDHLGHSTTSAMALLGVGPNISLDDQPKSGCPTANVTFNTPLLSGIAYQWQVSSNAGSSWTNVANGTDPSTAVYSGAMANNLTISNLPVSFNNNLYRYTANGLGCTVTSGNITLTVPALAVVVNPGNAVVDASENAAFTVSASGGSAPYTYKWTISTNGGISYANITDNATYSGSATNTLTVKGVTTAMYNYLYRPIVRNSGLCATANINFAKLVNNATLAMELQSFTAQKTATAAVQLGWMISHPGLSQSYTVQRSGDGLSFKDIGVVKGDGVSTSYTFTDDRPGDGKLLYRLKMTGWDARLTYSNVVSILNNEGATLMELRPSITAEGITHLYTSMIRGISVIVTVTDATGRLQSSETVRLQKGDNYTPIDVSRLGKGIYFIHIRSVDGIGKALPFIKN